MAGLAEQEDVEKRLRRELTSDEEEWLPGVLEEASLLVVSFCGRSFDPVPDEVRVVTSRVASRGVTALRTAPGADPETDSLSSTMGPFAFNHKLRTDTGNGGVYLTKADKQVLSRWVSGRQIFSVDMA